LARPATGPARLRTKTLDALRGVPWPREYSFRFLKNKLTEEWAGRDDEAFRAFGTLSEQYAQARARNDLDTIAVVCGESWGIYPLFFASLGLGVAAIGTIKAVYPATWGILQLLTGPVSDRWGRKWLIAGGMVVQAAGIWLTVQVPVYTAWIIGALLQGIGTAMVYPTLLAAISDVAHPEWRATAMGAYRFWRDLGYALGALISGVIADLLGMRAAIQVVAILTLLSGLQVAFRMRETHVGVKHEPESTPISAARL
jgi:MFS family permease